MPPSRAEYLAYQESLGTPYKPTVEVALGMIKTAAVSFEHLTNDPHWDRFLSYVQKKIDDTKQERDVYLELVGMNVGNAQQDAQIQYMRRKGYVEALEEIMMLPHQLRNAYDDVKQTAVPSSP